MAETMKPVSVPFTEAERMELLGYCGAQRKDFAAWAREVLLAAARQQSAQVPAFTDEERAGVERAAKSVNLAVPAFVRRATVAAVRRLGKVG